LSTGYVYIEISKGFEFKIKDSCCLHILKSIYSREDVGITEDQHLVKGLKELVFEQGLQSDECGSYQGTTMFMIYANEGILVNPDISKIEEAMSDF
jgi:hypothetical protein